MSIDYDAVEKSIASDLSLYLENNSGQDSGHRASGGNVLLKNMQFPGPAYGLSSR